MFRHKSIFNASHDFSVSFVHLKSFDLAIKNNGAATIFNAGIIEEKYDIVANLLIKASIVVGLTQLRNESILSVCKLYSFVSVFNSTPK